MTGRASMRIASERRVIDPPAPSIAAAMSRRSGSRTVGGSVLTPEYVRSSRTYSAAWNERCFGNRWNSIPPKHPERSISALASPMPPSMSGGKLSRHASRGWGFDFA